MVWLFGLDYFLHFQFQGCLHFVNVRYEPFLARQIRRYLHTGNRLVPGSIHTLQEALFSLPPRRDQRLSEYAACRVKFFKHLRRTALYDNIFVEVLVSDRRHDLSERVLRKLHPAEHLAQVKMSWHRTRTIHCRLLLARNDLGAAALGRLRFHRLDRLPLRSDPAPWLVGCSYAYARRRLICQKLELIRWQFLRGRHQ